MSEQRYITNLEYLKSRTTEEFAEFMKSQGCPPNLEDKRTCPPDVNDCKDCWVNWLRERGPRVG